VLRLKDKAGVVSFKQYVQAGGRVVMSVTSPAGTNPYALPVAGGNQVEFFQHDHLGSLVMTTTAARTIKEQFFCEPWGKRIDATGTPFGEYSDTAGQAKALRTINQTDRGYTMHEHLDELGYIHMNGRIYDPSLGRFAQADPFIPEATKLQAYNRYSYVYNNPLRYSDPTGYRPFWRQSQNQQTIRAVASIAVTAAIWYYAPQALAASAPETFTTTTATIIYGKGATDFAAVGASYATSYSTANAVATGFIAGAASGYISSGGDSATALKSGIVGGLFGFVGGTGATNGWYAQGAEGVLKYTASHAAIGCVSGLLDDSGCGRGAVSAAFGKLVTLGAGNDPGLQAAGTVLAGGVASRLGGGNFANGAKLAAFGYLFNEMLTSKSGYRFKSSEKYYSGVGGFFDDPRHSLSRYDTYTSGGTDAAAGFDYSSSTVNIGPVSFNFSYSLHDGKSTGGFQVSTTWGLGFSHMYGQIQSPEVDRITLTSDFINGKSASFGACYFLCGGLNASYDSAGRPSGAAKEVGAGFGFRASTGQLSRGVSPSVSVGENKP
jgi:RHS repeat-associated protein